MTTGGCVEHEAWGQRARGEKPSNSYLISSEDVIFSPFHGPVSDRKALQSTRSVGQCLVSDRASGSCLRDSTCIETSRAFVVTIDRTNGWFDGFSLL